MAKSKKTVMTKLLENFCKHEIILIGTLVGITSLFIFLLVLPFGLIPTEPTLDDYFLFQYTYSIYATHFIILFFFIIAIISFPLSYCIVKSVIYSKEPMSLSILGISLIITGISTTIMIVFINASFVIYTMSKNLYLQHLTYLNTTRTISVPHDIQASFGMLLQISLNFLLGGIGLIGVGLPILLTSMRGECDCKTEQPSYLTECGRSKNESEREKGGSLS